MHRLLGVLFICILFGSSINAQIVNVEKYRTDFQDTTQGVSGFVGLQMGLIKNNNSIVDIDLSGLVEYAYKSLDFLYIGSLEWLQVNDDNFINQGFHHFRAIHFPTKFLGYEAFAQYQYNPRITLQSRVLLGGGLTSILAKKNYKFRGGIGLMWEVNGFSEQETRDWRWNSYLSYHIKWPIGSFTLVGYFQPRLDLIRDLRSTLDSQLSFDIWKGLKFTTSLTLTYDSNIPDAIDPLVYSWTNGLQWKFK